MPFILTKDRIRSAIDVDTKSRMVINSGPEIDYNLAQFSSPTLSLDIQIEIRRKFSGESNAPADCQDNPGIMLSAGFIDWQLEMRNLADFEDNSRMVEYVIRMIAFINKYYPLALSPYLWSDYGTCSIGRKLLYHMPSDEELLRLSIQPE